MYHSITERRICGVYKIVAPFPAVWLITTWGPTAWHKTLAWGYRYNIFWGQHLHYVFLQWKDGICLWYWEFSLLFFYCSVYGFQGVQLANNTSDRLIYNWKKQESGKMSWFWIGLKYTTWDNPKNSVISKRVNWIPTDRSRVWTWNKIRNRITCPKSWDKCRDEPRPKRNKRNPKKKILFFQMRTIISGRSCNAENFFWM